MRFGESFSLRDALAHGDGQGDAVRWTLDKVAFEVFQRINRATPVTAPALVTLALLGVQDRAQTLGEVHAIVRPLLAYAAQRGLPTAALGALHETAGVEQVLGELVRTGVVRRYDGGLTAVFDIEPGQHTVAAFYRNSAIHWFVNRAIIELCFMAGAQQSPGDPLDRAWDAGFAIRDLLKFEFFFSEKQTFRAEIKAEARLLDPQLDEHIAARQTPEGILTSAPFLIAHRVLPAFLEAYYIVADRLAAQPTDAAVDQAAFLSECLAVGRQYVLQKRLRNPECVSRELFTNALSLAANRGLLAPGHDDLASRRQRFAEETTAAVAAVAVIADIDQRGRLSVRELQ